MSTKRNRKKIEGIKPLPNKFLTAKKSSKDPVKKQESLELFSAHGAENYLKSLDLTQIKRLLSLDTAEAHQQAFVLLKDYGLTAFQKWEKIHSDPSRSHLFSKSSPELVNDFAHMVLVYLDKTSKILELGCGYGNDALFIATHTGAQVTAIDASKTALKAAKKQIKQKDSELYFLCEDYTQTLKEMKGKNLDMIYCHSAANYWPARLFEDSILPSIAQALGNSGVFCLVMKTAHSGSAKAESQIRLNQISLEAGPYLYTLDKKDHLFNMYPKTKEILFEALKKYFEIAYEEEVEVEGYDKTGEVEVFVCVIVRPKKS